MIIQFGEMDNDKHLDPNAKDSFAMFYKDLKENFDIELSTASCRKQL